MRRSIHKKDISSDDISSLIYSFVVIFKEYELVPSFSINCDSRASSLVICLEHLLSRIHITVSSFYMLCITNRLSFLVPSLAWGPNGLEILLLTMVTTASTLTCSFLSLTDHYFITAALTKIVLAWRSVIPTLFKEDLQSLPYSDSYACIYRINTSPKSCIH